MGRHTFPCQVLLKIERRRRRRKQREKVVVRKALFEVRLRCFFYFVNVVITYNSLFFTGTVRQSLTVSDFL